VEGIVILGNVNKILVFFVSFYYGFINMEEGETILTPEN
jgi:hypothetical protein